MTRRTSIPVAIAALLLAGAGCDGCDGEPSPPAEHEVAWARLETCLSGDAPPTPERLARVALAAEIENVDDLPQPPRPEGVMGEPNHLGPPPDRRRWPRRCAPYAEELEDALDGEERQRARRVARALADGEIDDELFEMAAAARDWEEVGVSGVPPAPGPAAPLALADARYAVSAPHCRVTSVSPDTGVLPTRHVAHVACRGGLRYDCTVSGADLDAIACEPREGRLDVWSLSEARVGDWSLEVRRDGDRCTYVARRDGEETELGEGECGAGAWLRPCRAEGFAGVAFVHQRREGESTSRLALSDGDGFRLLDAPVQPQGDVVVSCEPGALVLHRVESRMRFIEDAPRRPAQIRPPAESVATVEQHRCTPEGCTTSTAERVAVGTGESAAPLSGRVILLEVVALDDEREGLVARIAPLDELDRGSPRWILDPADGAELERFGHFQWAVGPTAAVAFPSDQARGLLALRFDADGTVSYLTPR